MNRERLGRIATTAGYLFGALWVVVLFIVCRPGMMSPDSLSSWEQGLTGRFGNLYPPAMAVLMMPFARTVGSPWPLLLIQLAVIAFILIALAQGGVRNAGRRIAATALACLFLLLPSTWTTAVTHWKDVEFAAFFLTATWLLSCRRIALAGVVFAIGAAFRHNAILAVMPPAAFIAWWLWAHRVRSRVAGAAALAVIAGALAIPRAIELATNASDEFPLGQLFVFDLSALYVRHPDQFPGSLPEAQVDVSDLASHYNADHVWPLIWPWDGAPGFQMASLAQQRTALFREWMREIMRNPIDDLRHRWSHFRALMAFDRQRVCYPYEARIVPNAFGFTTPLGRPGFSSLFGLADAFADAWLFRAWVWTGLPVLLSIMALMPAIGSPLAAAVAASGAIYATSYAVIGVGCDFRFVYWTMLSVFAAAVILVRGEAARDVSDRASRLPA